MSWFTSFSLKFLSREGAFWIIVGVITFSFIVQKLEKVQVGLRAEQKTCDVIRERHAAAIAEQRRCHSLLKAFQVIAANMIVN